MSTPTPSSSSSTLYLYLSLPIIIFAAWAYTAAVVAGSLPMLRGKAIVLLIAHPDDEAMFFAPTLLALTKPGMGNHVKVLCLSNDGLGATREKEIVDSALRLGIRSASDVLVLNDPSFPDSMTTSWPSDAISTLLSSLFLKPSADANSSTAAITSSSSSSTSSARRSKPSTQQQQQQQPPSTTIDALITFDRSGISSHPNHISCHDGAVAWAHSLARADSALGHEPPVRVYSLTTVNLVRKYAGVLDAPFSLAWNSVGSMSWFGGGSGPGTGVGGAGGVEGLGKMRQQAKAAATASGKAKRREWPERLMVLSGVNGWITAMGAMVKAHKSQMVWFRWGWITIGRYMVVNDLRKVVG